MKKTMYNVHYIFLKFFNQKCMPIKCMSIVYLEKVSLLSLCHYIVQFFFFLRIVLIEVQSIIDISEMPQWFLCLIGNAPISLLESTGYEIPTGNAIYTDNPIGFSQTEVIVQSIYICRSCYLMQEFNRVTVFVLKNYGSCRSLLYRKNS